MRYSLPVSLPLRADLFIITQQEQDIIYISQVGTHPQKKYQIVEI